MDFIEHIEPTYLIIGLMIAFAIGHLIVQRRNSLKLTFQYRLVSYGIIMTILLFSLPTTPVLSTFFYPNDQTDIETKEKLLKLLQEYNKAIVKTTDVVYWMIFITTFWLVSLISSIIKHFKLEKPTE